MAYNEARFHQYMEELRGVAEGAKIPFEHIWVVNAQQELLGAQETMNDVKYPVEGSSHGCSDVTQRQELSHNEDAGTSCIGIASIVRYSFGDHHGCCFTYPGALPGWGPSSSNRLAYTINFLFPPLPTIDSRGTPVVGETVALASREMVFSRSAESAIEKMMHAYLAYGQNVNVSDATSTFTIEIGPEGCTSLKVIDGGSYFHGNMYQRLPLEEDWYAIQRILRFNELSGESPITILSDTEGECPIFRRLPDSFVTIFTCQFQLDDTGCTCKFWEHSGFGTPTINLEPFYVTHIPFSRGGPHASNEA
eukprot:GEMP01032243.1.p1 GENE.GEMP01032243.1~~GEMP01032243.1.p1  ORF type:complete len:307 (+),score=45.57 GEMP01032243.1:273-1193(+)